MRRLLPTLVSVGLIGATLSPLLRRPLEDHALARRLSDAAYDRVCDKFLTVTALEHWAALLERVL